MSGLPPLARGARTNPVDPVHVVRPTPACAGSTDNHPGLSSLCRAYPRLRGEHITVIAKETRRQGLPPLARGAPQQAPARPDPRGPTPACAGSTSRRRCTPQRRWAYPRLRGEHADDVPAHGWTPGLPPLARGAPVLATAHVWRLRPTPACAGSTGVSAAGRAGRGAYPRLRGEHCLSRSAARSAVGLPPLARGARLPASFTGLLTGPTPACAGSTSVGSV